jgi:hypothetical protein
MDEAIWNVLHDAEVVAADGAVPGDLRLSLDIAYLCGHLPTQAKHVVVVLGGCERFEYRPFVGPPVSDPAEVAALGLEVLSAGIADGVVRVQVSNRSGGGELDVRYQSVRITTAEGQSLAQTDLESAADAYWSLWEQKNAQRPATPDGGS